MFITAVMLYFSSSYDGLKAKVYINIIIVTVIVIVIITVTCKGQFTRKQVLKDSRLLRVFTRLQTSTHSRSRLSFASLNLLSNQGPFSPANLMIRLEAKW